MVPDRASLMYFCASLVFRRGTVAFQHVTAARLPTSISLDLMGRQVFLALACSSSNEETSVVDTSKRRQLLSRSLSELLIDAGSLDEAALDSIQNPHNGYDGRYGKSAIRTYRAFLYPKQQHISDDDVQLEASANRCARQIDFLLKRHKSHQSEYVRHHDAASSERTTFPLIVLLDNLRSAFNVGSIFRTADAAGCSLVITTGITPHPGATDKLSKSALGAELVVPSRHFVTTQEALNVCRTEFPDYQVIGMETTEQSVCYTDMKYSQQGAILVLGNEVTGVDTEILPELDAIVDIPMFGAKNSLNVAACAPVVLYEGKCYGNGIETTGAPCFWRFPTDASHIT